jgi:arabinogalactan endo-1,4-beta-galactosidase
MRRLVTSSLVLIMLLSFISCSSQSDITPKPLEPVVPVSSAFVKGADVGWLPQMEATGYRFLDQDGTLKDGLQLLKDRGINAVRLRVWVNPSNHKIDGHCSKEETVAMSVRAQKMGMRIMINFHYSDSWADPAKQNKPLGWANHSVAQLKQDVYNQLLKC